MDSAERGEPLSQALAAATEAARRAVERTPEQLDILREAGVVDAGGQGLYRALEGALTVLAGVDARPNAPIAPPAHAARPRHVGRPAAHARGRRHQGTWGYETVFLLRGHAPLDPERIRRRLEEIGESVLVGGDERLVKVHVHNARPDEVVAFGLALGAISEVAIQNLDDQTGEVVSIERSRGMASVGEPQRGDALPSRTGAGRQARPLAVVAVAGGAGLAEVFASFGVEEVMHGPRWGNPSTGEILAALERVTASAVIVLPNDPNVVLAAEQAARASPDREVVVVPTRSAPEGFAALLAMDPAAGARANLAPMLAAARDVQTLFVAVADRPSRLGGRTVTSGQTVVLGPDAGLVAADADPVVAIEEAVARLDGGYELLTFYIGDGGSDGEARTAIARIAERRPGTEAEVLPGGQPHYRYLISAE